MTTRAFEVPQVDDDLTTAVARGMAQVEDELAETIRTADALLDETSRHLVHAGGKRFRPMMVLLASHLGDPEAAGIVTGGVVVELTHLATLYHDDVMDEAEMRRGATSANLRWGNSVAILTGDYLFARCSELLADLGPDCVRLQAVTFARLVRGQVAETVGPRDGADPVQHYLDVLSDKTGSLIAMSARLGGMLAGVAEEHLDVLTRYGEAIGVAFQLADDVIDLLSDQTDSGKTPGTDLREGVATLPVLYARQSTDPADARLRQLVSAPVAEADLGETITLLEGHEAMTRAQSAVRDWARQAREALDPLPEGSAKRALRDLTFAVVNRTG